MRARGPAHGRPRNETSALRFVRVGIRACELVRQSVEPELAADDARFLQQALDRGSQCVEARRDHAVERRRNDGARALIFKDAHVFLDEQRISLGAGHDFADALVGAVTEKLSCEALGLLAVEWLERDRDGVGAA